MNTAAGREDVEAILTPSAWPQGRASQLRLLNGIEDYLFIGGDRISVAAAAARLYRTRRTIHRYRAWLRAAEKRTP